MKYTEEALNSEEYYELQEQESKIKSKKWMNVFLIVFSMLIIISLLVASSGSWTKFLIPNPPTNENKLSSTVHEEQVGFSSRDFVDIVVRPNFQVSINDMYHCRALIKKDSTEYLRCCGSGYESWCCSASDARAVFARTRYLYQRYGIRGPEAAVGESAPVGIQGPEADVGASVPVESNLETSVGSSHLLRSMSKYDWDLCRRLHYKQEGREALKCCASLRVSWCCNARDLAYWKRVCAAGRCGE